MNKQFVINVSMNVSGSLSEINEYIEEFKSLGGGEFLQKTNIQRTINGTNGDFTFPTMTHGKSVEFKLLVPLMIDNDSDFRGYFVSPMKYVSKFFDEFVKSRRTKSLPVTTDISVEPQVMKNAFFPHQQIETNYSFQQRWEKDKPVTWQDK